MAGLSAIGMGGKGQTKTSKATGNVALEGDKNENLSLGKQVWLRSVSPLRRATTSLFYHPGFCGSSYPRLL